MRRRAALGGSIAIHAAVGLALISVRSLEPESATERASIELVDVDPASLVELVDLSSQSSGGGNGGRADGASATRATRDDQTTHPNAARTLIARAEPRTRRQDIVRRAPTERSLADSLSDIATASQDEDRKILDGERVSDGRAHTSATSGHGDSGDSGDGDGGGRGGGHGTGIGRGVGSGLGHLASAGERLPAPPAAPRASKARPAKLIYPSRERQVDDGELFIARVTVDHEGYVVGAHLTKRLGGPKDDEAAGLIFRFRYAPALDEDGRPIKSQLDQQFLVGP
ncbi:MAG: hypothetical protein H0V17_27225 [Deltaproteobacteria bacterium]|nr:hypothetical protein [Deltaproteobacteria bacterium]